MVEYRGVKVPRIYGGSDKSPYSYTINDGRYGYFRGSKDSVLKSWQRVVDKALRRDAIYEGGYQTVFGDEELLECPRCGSLVLDPEKHSGWHAED